MSQSSTRHHLASLSPSALPWKRLCSWPFVEHTVTECCLRPMLCQHKRNTATNQAGMAFPHRLISVLERQKGHSSRWKVKCGMQAMPG